MGNLARRFSLEPLLLPIVVAASLWIMLQVARLQFSWKPPSTELNLGWLDFMDNDGGPESACDCVALLRGDAMERGKAKMLTLSKEFRKRVRVPDEFYIHATQDCRFDCSFCSETDSNNAG